MICVRCNRDFGGSREAYAKHVAEFHRGIRKIAKIENDDLIALSKVDDERAKIMREIGLDTYQKIADAPLSTLTGIKGIGLSTARAIKGSALKLGGGGANTEQGPEGTDKEV